VNPNSIHQLWSKWTVIIKNPPRRPHYEDVKTNTARFISSHYGHAGSCRIREFPKAWVIEALIESSYHPLDKSSFNHIARTFTEYFKQGFGAADIIVKSKLMAGQRLDSQPPDQLLIMPTVVDQELFENARHVQ